MGLSNYQLVLLDNLIYLDEITRNWTEYGTLEDVVNRLLYKDGDPSNGIGSGTINQDYYNHDTGKDIDMTSRDEWIRILRAIKSDPVLCNLQIHSVVDDTTTGFRAATFISDMTDENVIIFRGSSTVPEWIDNGHGGYMEQTTNQKEALDYVNSLDIVNNYAFITSGHSKGGNLAQYVTIMATDTTIDKCLSLDGQGFSEEFCQSAQYQLDVLHAREKLYAISSENDYVNVLFHTLVPKEHNMYLMANHENNPTHYHKACNVLHASKQSGIYCLNGATHISPGSYLIKDFVGYMLQTEDIEDKELVFDSLMSILAAGASKEDDMETLTVDGAFDIFMCLTAWLVVSQTLSGMGLLALLATSVTAYVAGVEFSKEDVDLVCADGAYKGELCEFVDEGALAAAIPAFLGYLAERGDALLCFLDCANVLPRMALSAGPAGQALYTLWDKIMDVREAEGLEIRNEDWPALLDTNLGTTTLGEGMAGVGFTEMLEDGTNLISGTGSIDYLSGTAGNDDIYGGNGRDFLLASDGHDGLTGGRGDDKLYGGRGMDIYSFGRYDGIDEVYNVQSETDMGFIYLKTGILYAPENIRRNGDDLVIITYRQDAEDTEGTSAVTVEDFFKPDGEGGLSGAVDVVCYADGPVLFLEDICRLAGYEGETGPAFTDKLMHISEEDRQYIVKQVETGKEPWVRILAAAGVMVGTSADDSMAGAEAGEFFLDGDGNDTIDGRHGDDILYGGSGDDSLYGFMGNDILCGGTGDDYLEGGSGDDTYLFSLGDGCDTIADNGGGNDILIFGEGIRPADIEVSGDAGSIYLKNRTNGDCVKLAGCLAKPANFIRTVRFADGTQWGQEDLKKELRKYQGTAGDDTITAYDRDTRIIPDDDVLHGGDGNDTMDGRYGNDEIYGEAGDDCLYGGYGNDILCGGRGNDYLEGGPGDDTYLFSLGDGCDTIADNSGGNDVLIFGEGIRPGDIEVSGDAASIYLKNRTNGDCVKLADCLGKTANFIQTVRFADGTEWGQEDLKKELREYQGTAGDDTITAYDRDTRIISDDDRLYGGDGNDTMDGRYGNDEIYGEAGDDSLYGGFGDDILCGGAGNDYLEGGFGDDTYLFSLGDGCDTIADNSGGNDILIFGEGIRPGDIEVSGDAGSIYLKNRTNGDCVKLADCLAKPANFIKTVRFADGTEWEQEDLKKELRKYQGTAGDDTITAYDRDTRIISDDDVLHGGDGCDTMDGRYGNDEIYGEAGDDSLYGGFGNDILCGGRGNDYLEGGIGDDTYLFFLGDGCDTIADISGGNDILIFGEGIRPADMEITSDGKSVYLENCTNGDCVKLADCLTNANNFIKTIRFADGTEWDASYVREHMQSLEGEEAEGKAVPGSGRDVLTGSAGDEELTGGAGNDNIFGNGAAGRLFGGSGQDYIQGGSGTDFLYGESGDDRLYAYGGNDILDGGTGNDTLSGGAGNDTYIFRAGDGQDTITDDGGDADQIVFGEGIFPEDIRVTRDENSLYLKNRKTGDQVKVESWFTAPARLVETVQFADGTEWDEAYLRNAAGVQYGTENKDSLWACNRPEEENMMYGSAGSDSLIGGSGPNRIDGGSGNDRIQGGAGEDILWGGSGDDIIFGKGGSDILCGGTGNDTLSGGAGNDTYIFHAGDGQDTITDEAGDADQIVFGEGISPEDIDVSRDAYSLYLKNRKTGDQVKVENCFTAPDGFVETVQFADGTEWDEAYLRNAAGIHPGTEQKDNLRAYGTAWEFLYGRSGGDSLYGGSGSDFLYGQSGDDRLYAYGGDDTLDGGTGNDDLRGGVGNDTYFFHAGDGQDTITDDGGDVDQIVFGEGIAPEDIRVSRDEYSLYLENRKTGDQVKVEEYFRYDARFVESVAFADGTEWDEAYLRNAARIYWGTEASDTAKAYDQFGEENLMYGGAGTDNLVGGNNTNRINGGSGDDSIQGGAGEDILYGGSGNDKLCGNGGDDILCGDTGNDHLYGGAGDDTYVFQFGDGKDIITDNGGGDDTLLFGEGISPEELLISKSNDSVFFTNRINGDSVKLEYQLTHENCRIETVRTSDGSYIDYTKLELMIQAMASFEADTGMGWAQAMEERNAQALEIVNQWWVRDGN